MLGKRMLVGSARKAALGVALVTALGASLTACAPNLPENQPVTEARWLDQNWSPDARFWFHHATQGTSTLPVPYDWFVALERPELWLFGDPPLMKDSEYLRRFGFIPSPRSFDADTATLQIYGYGADDQAAYAERSFAYDEEKFPGNPDGLPVGFARLENARNPIDDSPLPDQIGFTCAACHTGHLEYNGVSLRIDGAPAVTDLGKFREALGLALAYTNFIPSRFERFADRVLGENHSEQAAADLEQQLDTLIETGKAFKNTTKVVFDRNVEEGFARLDALTRIGNQVFFTDLLTKDGDNRIALSNLEPISAPVNYPHIWDTSWFLWVQYDASIMQPMVRNAGEALGVSARVNLVNPSEGGKHLYRSAVEVGEIFELEELLAGPDPFEGEPGFKGLRAPEWPGDLFEPIDEERQERGRALYVEHCQECHLPPVDDPAFWTSDRWTSPDQAGQRYLVLTEKLTNVIGTDPAQAQIMVDRTVRVPEFLGIDPGLLCNGEPGGPVTETSFAAALAVVVEKTTDRWYDDNGVPEDQRDRMNGYRPNCIVGELKYKARPLDGIWATAPYLHNGSVPNLYEMLSPAAERSETFYLGSRQFDPIKVGYESERLPGGFLLDTRKPGNSNKGHEFKNGPRVTGVLGPELSHDERMDLIEYLKRL